MRLITVSGFVWLLCLPVGVQAEDYVEYPTNAGAILETLGEVPAQTAPVPEANTTCVLKITLGRPCKGVAELVEDPKEVAAVLDARPELPKVAAKAHFASDSARIQAQSHRLLDQYAAALGDSAMAGAVLAIAGHTDYQGTDTYNWNLALRRAYAVRDYLQDKGVSIRMVVTSYGETQPVAGDAQYQAPEEMALNRRVEFVRMR